MKKPSTKPRKASRGPKSGYRSKLAKSEFASLKETFEFSTLSANAAYYDYNNSLARNVRAASVAHGYREYRITKVEYQFIPLFDTFTAGGSLTVPQLYYMIDKDGTFASVNTADQLMEAGAKPRRLDDKTIRIVFKPTVLGLTFDKDNLTNPFSKPMVSPWLATNKMNVTGGWGPSSIDHMGITFIVDADPSLKYNVRVTSHIQFRKPSWLLGASVSDAPAAIQAPAKRAEESPVKPPTEVPVV